MKFVELGEEEFREFEQKNPYGNLYQMAERARLREKMGWTTKIFGVREGRRLKVAGLVLARDGMAMVPMGPVVDWDKDELERVDYWVRKVIEWAKSEKMVTLEIFPPVKQSVRDVKGNIEEQYERQAIFEIFARNNFEYMGATTEIENKANRWVTVKDLAKFKSVDEMRASYKKNVRNKLRKCSPEIEIVEVRDEAGLKEVARAIEGSNEKNGMRSRAIGYYKWILEEWGEQVHFVLARRKEDGETVAGRVIFDHPNETVSFISGTVQKYRKMNAMTVLQDDLLTKCFEKGIRRVNFYGLAGDFSEANKLLEFKSGFGVKVEEYIGGFRIVLRPVEHKIRRAKGGAMRAMRGVKNKLMGARK
ncbi:peptidoglycan bridge formation glycyltransferase FemA/FemB family protein [Candidatus Saccharibacteria bacterium]|nr:peptidoglycan bridge formation glycyltransferase FemA/FemB family protein [Candidatus Saccharibacteria bacterium]